MCACPLKCSWTVLAPTALLGLADPAAVIPCFGTHPCALATLPDPTVSHRAEHLKRKKSGLHAHEGQEVTGLAITHSYNFSCFSRFVLFLYFIWVNVCLPVWEVHHRRAWYPWRTEDDIRSSGAGLPEGCEPLVGSRNGAPILGKTASACNR